MPLDVVAHQFVILFLKYAERLSGLTKMKSSAVVSQVKSGNQLLNSLKENGMFHTQYELWMENILYISKSQHTLVVYTTTIKDFSIFLLPLVDANYKFIWIELGGMGHMCDSQIFLDSELPILHDITVVIVKQLIETH